MTYLRYLSMALLLLSLSVRAELNTLEQQWDALVSAHVQSGQVDYPGLQQDARFAAVISAIGAATLADTSAPERLTFYINAYNALAIEGILRGLSPRTALGKLRYFYRTKYTVAGTAMTLNQLEHEIIRPLNEPRIHFALVCASTSCPALQSTAYRAAALDQQLASATAEFINDSTKNTFSLSDGNARISKIFKWFKEDFVASAGSVAAFIAPYVDDPAISRALQQQSLKTSYLPYDWHLNGTPPHK